MKDNKIVSKRLKEAMQSRKIKQAEIVSKTNIPKSSISSYLSGKYVPKQTNIYKLSKVLNVSPAWLMGVDVSMNDNKDLMKPNSTIITELINQVDFLDNEDKIFLKRFIKEKEKEKENQNNNILGTEIKKILSRISKELNLDYETIENIFMNYKAKPNELTELNYNNIKKIIINVLEDEKQDLI